MDQERARQHFNRIMNEADSIYDVKLRTNRVNNDIRSNWLSSEKNSICLSLDDISYNLGRLYYDLDEFAHNYMNAVAKSTVTGMIDGNN